MRAQHQIVRRIRNHVFLDLRQIIADGQRQTLPAKHVDINRNSSRVHRNGRKRRRTEYLPFAAGNAPKKRSLQEANGKDASQLREATLAFSSESQ